jgi:hypothetical protein
MKTSRTFVFLGLLLTAAVVHAESPQGMYLAKNSYKPSPLPVFSDMKARLPSPIYDDNPTYVAMYWKAWELAFKNFHEPTPQNGFVSQFIDAAFNQNIFQLTLNGCQRDFQIKQGKNELSLEL